MPLPDFVYPETSYRRPLPLTHATSWKSKEGRKLFAEALDEGHMEGYFLLAEQFRTQANPSYCSVSTLVMALNALGVDPLKCWDWPWRWYDETMLTDLPRNLKQVIECGIDFDEFADMAQCNGLAVIPKRPNKQHCSESEQFTLKAVSNNKCGVVCFDITEFRNDVITACLNKHEPLVIVSYGRAGLDQTGIGHFTIIGGYHKAKDMVLIMDVARFKYPPHWVTVDLLFKAMCFVDKVTNQTRGWMVASKSEGFNYQKVRERALKLRLRKSNDDVLYSSDEELFTRTLMASIPQKVTLRHVIGLIWVMLLVFVLF